ncbi:MAG: VOC family protein [Gemmatimonadetes bacterium]|nr:VOC family protein [Gemmatimonadota bacterium]
MAAHALHWFEIPARDLARAFTFYATVLDGHVRMGTFGGAPLALFDVPFHDGSAVGGSIVQREGLHPSADGVVLYLNLFGPLAPAVARVTAAGGIVLAPHIDLGTFGTAALIVDTEGNRIGLLEPPAR